MDTTEELRSVRARVALRDHQRLRDALETIDEQGWSGSAATALLTLVREDLVRPLVVGLGVRGAASWQAEATGWAAAWESLREPSLRSAVSPWGVVWTATRRAVMGEMLAARYCTSVRKAWRLHAECGFQLLAPALVDVDGVPDDELGRALDAQDRANAFGPSTRTVLDVLVQAGWKRPELETLVDLIGLELGAGASGTTQKSGWRSIALELGVEPWRVRRLMTVLVGEPGWAGLVERVWNSGPAVLDEAGPVAAIQSTVLGWMSSPSRQARLAEAKAARRGEQGAA